MKCILNYFIKFQFGLFDFWSSSSDSQLLREVPFPHICFVLLPFLTLVLVQGFKKCSANSNLLSVTFFYPQLINVCHQYVLRHYFSA